ncbi:hypothetical protein [Maribellus sediminis]|uniref:hypothetical protein n=1 Tax=Maribellus sediminis TaxID=2696285 RepID=UPI0014308761|nr:hypothetical protein [Maribellus sediminis]
MKTKVFLLLCLFVSTAIATSFAQEKANNATQGWSTFSPGAIGIFCDGVMIDRLVGEIDYHWVGRGYKNGVPYREIEQLKGNITSDLTGETFRIRRTDKWEYTGLWTLEVTYNFIGDKGSVYTGKFTLDYSTFTFSIDHVNCH